MIQFLTKSSIQARKLFTDEISPLLAKLPKSCSNRSSVQNAVINTENNHWEPEARKWSAIVTAKAKLIRSGEEVMREYKVRFGFNVLANYVEVYIIEEVSHYGSAPAVTRYYTDLEISKELKQIYTVMDVA